MRRLALAALVAAAALTACYEDEPVSARGALARVKLADAPFPYDSVTAVNVFVKRIELSTSSDTLVPGTTTVVTPDRLVNLLDFQQGAAADLGQGEVDPATYRLVNIVIDPAQSSIMHGTRSVPVDWGFDGEIQVHSVVEGGLAIGDAGATIVIDFDVGRSFKPLLQPDSSGTSHYEFRPWTRAVIEEATGRVSGTVTCGGAPLGNATIFAFGGPVGEPTAFATGRTRADGTYTIAFLMPDEYHLSMEPLASSGCGGASGATSVTQGTTATLDLAASALP